jgi:hypothetical protein
VRSILTLALLPLLAIAGGAARAETEAGPRHRVLVELFTSQG